MAIEQGLDAAGIAFLFSVTAILGALAQIPAGRLSDRIDRRLVMIGLAGVAALVGLLIVLVNPGPGLAMYVLFGIYGFSAYPDLCDRGGARERLCRATASSPRSRAACC